MRCTVLKPFTLSEDGITSRSVAVDEVVNVPADLVDGLKAEGFVAVAVPGHETKVIERAPEVGRPVLLDDDSEGLSLREIHADLEGAGAEFDPRDDRAALLAQREAVRTGAADAVMAALPSFVEEANARHGLSDAQAKALDRDGDRKPGGSPKGGNRKKAG